MSGSSRVRPDWLRVRAPAGKRVDEVSAVLTRRGLQTVCREARCPNVGECWGRGTATVLILGKYCTRGCTFCSVEHGTTLPPDPDEPAGVAAAALELGWRHLVVTSVTRDDLPDGGAAQFARVVEAIRREAPDTTVELLIPDFQGDAEALRVVLECHPDMLAHNVETVPRLYPAVRPGAQYRRSLELLARARAADRRLPIKSGLMLGFGELRHEVIAVIEELHRVGVRALTVGQYLSPSPRHLPVVEYIRPEIFEGLAEYARRIGFDRVQAGPLVRSSYAAGSDR